MKIIYENTKTEKQCTSIKEATKLFGGDKRLANSLLARINAIEQADVIKDIIVMPTFRFHNLKGKLDGYFACCGQAFL
uniref:type II toxin-antitoxin system RelE/ParE family toxin n=1 Tax=Eubacterium cellulosolvens TaxID=29322 RepID=UPI000684A652|nr:type II toxin-antitoxin system RelE/ParE family toxin [[Eubacterium] cellulosolvens]